MAYLIGGLFLVKWGGVIGRSLMVVYSSWVNFCSYSKGDCSTCPVIWSLVLCYYSRSSNYPCCCYALCWILSVFITYYGVIDHCLHSLITFKVLLLQVCEFKTTMSYNSQASLIMFLNERRNHFVCFITQIIAYLHFLFRSYSFHWMTFLNINMDIKIPKMSLSLSFLSFHFIFCLCFYSFIFVMNFGIFKFKKSVFNIILWFEKRILPLLLKMT